MPARTKLIQGTFILTFVGILSRFMGFFFRMFTSHIFGEENVGLYQLIFPVYLFCLSLSTAGIEAAISRTVAQKASRGKYIEAQSILYTGLFFSVLFSRLSMEQISGVTAPIPITAPNDIKKLTLYRYAGASSKSTIAESAIALRRS